MITTSSTKFANNHNSISLSCHMIIHIDNGSNDWYLSDIDMDLTDGHVYPLLVSSPTIKESVDIFKKNWSTSDITIKLSNKPYYKPNASTAFRNLSDEMSNLYDADLKVYLASGTDISTLATDCPLRFSGKIIQAPKYDNQYITIKAVDYGTTVHKVLPSAFCRDIYNSMPPAFQDEKIPLVYGEFDGDDYAMSGSGYGMAKAIPNHTGLKSRYVISDHTLDALSALWFVEPELPDPAKYDSPTLNTNDSGRGTANGNRYLVARIYPDSAEDDGYSTEGYTMPSDHYEAFDRSLTSYTEIDPNIQTSPPMGILMLSIPNDDFFEKSSLYNDSGFKFDINAKELGIKTIADSTARLYYASDGTNDRYLDYAWATSTSQTWSTSANWTDLPNKTGTSYTITNVNNTEPITVIMSGGHDFYDSDKIKIEGVGGCTDANGEWSVRVDSGTQITLIGSKGNASYTSGGTATNITNKNKPYTLGLYVEGDTGAYGDTLMNIYEARILFRYRQGQVYNYGWAVCQGREYDTWIDSRSSNYSSGDMIEDPAGIIESILRDELGLSSTYIDEDAFDGAENTSMAMRINLHSDNEENSKDIIRRICEQSTFAFHFSGAGKAKLIPLNDSSPTTDRVIPFSHIVNGKITIDKTNFLVNRINVDSRYMQEYETHGESEQFNNTTSQTALGTYEYDAKWDNIADTSVSHLTAHLVTNTTTGIWAYPHNQIEFETALFTNADLEVGDWIELDDTNTDPQIKCYGSSWSGKQFLVTSITVNDNKTKIKAIELY